jgi:hypothetical protein
MISEQAGCDVDYARNLLAVPLQTAWPWPRSPMTWSAAPSLRSGLLTRGANGGIASPRPTYRP